MIIRSEQMDQLRQSNYPQMTDRIAEHLRDNHESAVIGFSDDELKSRIQVGLKRAEEYELESEAAFGAFVAIMFEVAPNFDEHPNIKKALTDEKISPDSRILDITHRTTPRDWEEAEKAYDPHAWEINNTEIN